MSDYIDVGTTGGVQTITLNRPDKKNALDMGMYSAMAEALRTADDNRGIRVSLIRGTEGCFCSGNDISDFLKNPPVDGNSPVLRFLNAIIGAKKPVIAEVDGIAIGIGTTMLLHCDLVYASDRASFQLPFVNLGLCPEAGSSLILPLLVGHRRSSEMLLLGDRFDAQAAQHAGIVNHVCAHEALGETTRKVTARIAAQPPSSVQVTKSLLRSAMLSQIQQATARENEHFLPLLHGEEAREALQAFMEKRPADFSRF